MRVLHYIPERLLSSEEEGGFHGSTDLTREYLSVLTTGMGKGIEVQVTTTLSQFKQKVKEIQPDIVHIHACWNISAYRAQHWTMKQRVALVLSPHNGMQPWHIHHHFWLHKLPLLILYQRHAIKTADAIHVFSQSEHQRMKAIKWNTRRVAQEINIPFTVGGGINALEDVERLLHAGADKVSVNSAAIRRPELIDEITRRFGSQVCVCAIDARFDPDGWHCYVKGGRERVERGLFEWAHEAQERGAGEILFTSMDHDGVKEGYANEALARLADDLKIPIIASGGAGKKEHFRDAFTIGKADAALAASVFHFGEIPIPELKEYLQSEGINVRPPSTH